MEKLFIWTFSYLTLQMFLTWIIARRINNPGVIDLAWPIGLVVCGLVYLYAVPLSNRNLLISIVLVAWGLRLASHLFFTRIKKGIVEKRYLALSQTWPVRQSIGFLVHFQVQGWLIFILSAVFFLIASVKRVHLLDYVGMIFCIVGIIGERMSDKQLLKFKQTHPHQVCDIGLWRFSRHPNCFFDWLTWVGFALFGLSANYGWLSVTAPLLLYFIMVKVTIPITEEGSIKSRGDLYRTYQQNTPLFFPSFRACLK